MKVPGKDAQENPNSAMAEAFADAAKQAKQPAPEAAQPSFQAQPSINPTQPQNGTPNMTQQFQQTQVPPAPEVKRSRLFDMNMRRERTFSAQNFGENFNRAFKAITDYAENTAKDKGYKKSLFIIPVNDPGLHCASLVFAKVFSISGKTLAVVFPMLLENTGSPLKPQSGNDPITGERFELARMTGSQYDDVYWNVVKHTVSHALGQAGAIVQDAGAGVIHSDMDWDDTTQIARLLNHAENACITLANTSVGGRIEEFFNVKVDINPEKDLISAGFNFNTASLISPDGMPIRNDVEIKLTASSKDQGQVQVSEPLTVVNGFVELLPAPTNPNAQFQLQQMQMMGQLNPQAMLQFSRRFCPQFVISNTSTGISNSEGPEFQLLAIYAASLIGENYNWHNAFSPRLVDGVDIGDIGAINYEMKMGMDPSDPAARPAKLDTKSSSFTQASLQQLLMAACHDNFGIALDIEENGLRSWINTMFLLAGGATGTSALQLSEGGKAAHAAIIAAANNLTGNTFSTFFDASQLITVRDGTRIQGGYYTDAKGVKQDVRNIDMLAVLNLTGGQDPHIVEEWKMINSQVNHLSIPKRMALRNQRLAELLGTSYTNKTYFERVVFNWPFVDALRKALGAAGLIVHPDNMHAQYNQMAYMAPLAQTYGMPTNTPTSLQQVAWNNFQPDGRQINMGYRTGQPFGNYNGF